MFKKNKYSKIYFKIINNAKKENRSKKNSYFEKHHIIPVSLKGTNYKQNLVLLTAREHYICHLLLTKIVNNKYIYKMINAYMIMSKATSKNQKRNYKINSNIYENLKIKYSNFKSAEQSGKGNSNFGNCWITNFKLEQTKLISKKDLYKYKNWELGQIKDFKNSIF